MGAPFKDKIQVFFFGLMLGLLIGVCFFVFKLDGYFRELSFYKSNEKNTSQKEIVAEVAGDKTKVKKSNYAISSKQIKPNAEVVLAQDSSLLAENPIMDSDTNSTISDSLQNDSSEEIIIKKDEMVSFKAVELQLVENGKETTGDSLANKLSGVKKENTPLFFKVEYWMSPLNYKGYKMLKNKIILYGINSAESVKLYKLDGVIYFKSSASLYKMDYTAEFRPLELITDESLLAKIK